MRRMVAWPSNPRDYFARRRISTDSVTERSAAKVMSALAA
jgi:hypothetical protein